MKAVVLAAGKGSRLGRHTDYAAKGMLRVGGAPILWHCLAAVARLAPEEIVLVRGHGGAISVETAPRIAPFSRM